MKSSNDNKDWSLIRNDNGEWISKEHVVFFTEAEARLLRMQAVKKCCKFSFQHGPNGGLWCYKHELALLKVTII